MRYLLIPFLLCSAALSARAGSITGQVTDTSKQPLAFSSIVVKGTAIGTSANSLGEYSLVLNAGEYTLIAQHIGYKSEEIDVIVGKDVVHANFALKEQTYNLGNVIIKNGEDPAYEIIRNAIKKEKRL